MLKAGKIQLVCYSPQAFYTLKGQESTEPMIGYHTGVVLSPIHQQRYRHLSNDPVYRIIQNLPLGRRSLHDIRKALIKSPLRGHVWHPLSIAESGFYDINFVDT
jgi:hypothetical protein